MNAMTTTEAATKIRKEKPWLYQNALHMLHTTLEGPSADPLCMREMVDQLGWDDVKNDPLYSLLTELQETGYWYHNWAPMDNNGKKISYEDREFLFNFEDAEEIEPAMDAIRVYIKRFNAASKIQAVFRGAMTRVDTDFSESVRINPNDLPDNTPPDSGEGLNLDYYGVVEGHPYWGSWRPNLNRWVYQCPSQILTWWWDSSKRVWVRDTTSAFFERFEGKW